MDWELFIGLASAFGVGSLITAVVQYFLEKNRSANDLISNARRVVYGKLLGKLRNVDKPFSIGEFDQYFGIKPSDAALIRQREVEEVISEAILLAGTKLREKLVLAANSIPNQWEDVYGKPKGKCLKEIEELMKNELKIK